MVGLYTAQKGFPAERKKFKSLYTETSFEHQGETEKICLVRPQTYMNLSGHAVRSFIGYFLKNLEKDLNENLLIIHDDMDLPEGKLRFKSNGSCGGHKGLRSILNHVGHDSFSRLKIGIGRDSQSETKDFVLERVTGKSREVLDQAVERSCEGLTAWLYEGIEVCMDRFNQTED